MKVKSKISSILTFFVIIGITFSIPLSYATENNQNFFIENQNQIFINDENEKYEIHTILKFDESINVTQDKTNHDTVNSPPTKVVNLKLSDQIHVTTNDPNYPLIVDIKYQSDKQTTKEKIFNSEKLKSNYKLINFVDESITIKNLNDNFLSSLIQISSLDELKLQSLENNLFINNNFNAYFVDSNEQILSILKFVQTNEFPSILDITSNDVDQNNPAILLLLAPLTGVVLIYSEKNNFKLKISRQSQAFVLALLIIFSAATFPFSISNNYWGYAYAEEFSFSGIMEDDINNYLNSNSNNDVKVIIDPLSAPISDNSTYSESFTNESSKPILNSTVTEPILNSTVTEPILNSTVTEPILNST
ncbi:MAG: hypothetical protein AAB089_04035, partial [Nitrospirota bacterium]